MKEEDEDKRLADYLLGNLPEPEQVRLEEKYLADPRIQERLLVVEGELVDAYLQGRLAVPERKRFEAGFLASPRGRRKLELTRSLMVLATESQRDESPAARARKPFRGFSIRWLFATAALVVVLVLAWSIWTKAWHSPGSQHAVTKNPAQQPHTDGQISPGSGYAAHASVTPIPRISPLWNPQFSAVASVILRPVGRSVEQSQRVRIRRGTLLVQIRLELEVDNHANYRVDLLGAKDDKKWSGHGLKTQTVASAQTIVLKLPASLFDNGEYTLVVSPEENSASPIAEYPFFVDKELFDPNANVNQRIK